MWRRGHGGQMDWSAESARYLRGCAEIRFTLRVICFKRRKVLCRMLTARRTRRADFFTRGVRSFGNWTRSREE